MISSKLLLDAFLCGSVVLHFNEGETVFFGSASFGGDALDVSAFLEHGSEVFFNFLDVGLTHNGGTFPSRLEMNSLLVRFLSSYDLLSACFSELDSLSIQLYLYNK